MVESVELLMMLLAAGFVGTRLAQWLRLPHSVFLVIAGIAAGLVLRHNAPAEVQAVGHLFPEIILFLLLPPLVFESAYNFDLKDLKRDFVPISVLAVLALLCSAALVGFGLHWLFGLALIPSLTFGALISATDPVAVVALFKKIGAPKRLNALVEGESLLNDGTAIVLYRVLVGFGAAATFSSHALLGGVKEFFVVAIGGAFVGLIAFGLISMFLRFVSDSAAQLGLTVVTAYLSFIVADHVFHVSGVISTMVVGLLLGHKARLEFNKGALHGMHYVWEFLALVANTVVFFLVGLSVDPEGLRESLHLVLPTLGLVYWARALAIYFWVPLLNWAHLCRPISAAYQTILVWGGLRGGLALALVLLLPGDFPHRQLFLSLASAVVLSTLFLNALTIEKMLKWFGLNKLGSQDERMFLKTLQNINENVLQTFQRAQNQGHYSREIVDREQSSLQRLVVSNYADSDLVENGDLAYDRREAFLLAILHEQSLYNEQLENGVLSKSAYQRIMNAVQDRLDLLESGDWNPLFSYSFIRFTRFRKTWRTLFGASISYLSEQMEVLLHLHLALGDTQRHLAEGEVKDQYAKWSQVIGAALEQFYTFYPDCSAAIQTQYLSAAVTSRVAAQLSEKREVGEISGAVAARLQDEFEAIHAEKSREARELLSPRILDLLRRVPLFRDAEPALLDQLSKNSKRARFGVGDEVVTAGELGNSFFLVTAGVLEVQSESLRKNHHLPRMFVGDFFGEMSLLFDQPRSATVKAIVPSEVLEVEKSVFEDLLAHHQNIKDRIVQIAVARQQQATEMKTSA